MTAADDLPTTVEGLALELKRARAMERVAARHAMQRDADIAESESRVAHLKAEIARLNAALRQRDLELHDIREGVTPEAAIVGLLREAVTGRRFYVGNAPDEHTRDLLEIECRTIENCLKVLAGDTGPLYNWLPSHMWTEDMVAALYPERRPT